jgi:hypothetical protein
VNEIDNNFPPDFLSETHRQWILAYVEKAEVIEQATVDALLKGKA